MYKMMDKEKMSKLGAPDIDAKKDVIKALRKMAMQMMAEGGEDEDGAVMAKLQMKKLDPEALGDEAEMGEEVMELPEMSEEGMEDEELDPREVLELLKQAK